MKLGAELDKATIVDVVDKWRFDLGFSLDELNTEKPWGAYWKIQDRQVQQFIHRFFPKMLEKPIDFGLKMSPKLLLVAPNEKLSWQYHERRAENWVVVAGNLGIKTSMTDKEPETITSFNKGQSVRLENGTRHRLISTGEWGLVAEIWGHTDEKNPSNEEDIVRLADNYGRENKNPPF